ncbi:MAG TPA: beta-propeller fold lactonase family protein [Gaiellaceae bacterium]
MRFRSVLAVMAALIAVTLSAAQAVYADGGRGHRDDDDGDRRGSAVFVQTNELDGNRILVFDRASSGRLSPAGSFSTGGNGGNVAPGTASDRLGSQGSLVYDEKHRLLFAVNAGSDTLAVFRVRGNRLKLKEVLPSGGDFPASVAVHDNLVYVLNAGGAGIVQGFVIHGNRVRPLEGSARSLGLANTDPPNFLTSPGQVGFTPSGRELIVTTKASKSTIEVFHVGRDGRLSESPVVNPSATPVPFAFTFDQSGRLVMGEAAMSAVTTYDLNRDGTLANPQSLSDNQVALCWIVRARGFFYVSNTGSNTLSGYRIDGNGTPSLVGATGIVATTGEGPIDMTTAAGGRFLYAQTGAAGTVEEFSVNGDGTLTRLGVVTGLPVGQEGIAAS